MNGSTLPKTETIVLTPDYQIVIPPSIRKQFGLQPGQKLQVIYYAGRLEIVPEISPEEARGSMPDLRTDVERDDEDRL